MNVSSVLLSVPTRSVKWCYHSTNWSHTSRPASSGEWLVDTATCR